MSRGARKVSQAAFARAAGISRRQVARHVDAGVLELGDDGLIELAAGKRALKAQRKKRDAAGDAARDDNAELRQLRGELVKVSTDWRRATAQIRMLELAVKRGEYVSLADVRRDGANVAAALQSVLRSIPQRTAMELACACRSAAVTEHVIAGEVERAIGTLANESVYVGPFDGETMNVVCGQCAERTRKDAAEAARRAELEADGVAESWQDVLLAAIARCLQKRPRAGDEIDIAALPVALREGFGAAPVFLRAVARVAYEERLMAKLATQAGRER